MFSHILTPLDGSPQAACVLPHVVALARATGARITLLRVLERSGTVWQESIHSIGRCGNGKCRPTWTRWLSNCCTP